MNKNHVISLFAIGVAALSLPVSSLAQTSNAQTPPKASSPTSPKDTQTTEKVELLFVQNATSGNYDDKTKTLTLTGIGPTIFFSDRPERITGQVRTSEFISHWSKGADNFASNPPNATLSIFGANGVDSTVVELTNPKLTNNVLSYNVKVLRGQMPAAFKESSLFIDIFGRWRMYAAGAAMGAAAAGAGNYYYHTPAVIAPVYVAPRPIVVY